MSSQENLNIETVIKLKKFVPRDYQLPICDALENKGYRRILAIMPRRSGKDYVCWNLLIRAAIRRVAVYYYIFPTFAQAKRAIWDSITNSGERFLDMVPPELVESMNSQQLIIRFKNGSIIQLQGSNNYDALMGTNPYGIIFSEYALQDPMAYAYLRPILLGNGGWAIFESTPRSKNHLYEMYNIAKDSPDWFCYKVGLNETKHIPYSEIQKEIDEGIISQDMVNQEYFCSFEQGAAGSYYIKYLDKMRLDNRIGIVPWESSYKVYSVIDIGVHDSTCIIWFQAVGATIRIIDCYSKNKEGLEHYINVIQSKPYVYARHFCPHDMAVKEFGSGLTRLEKARNLGLHFIPVKNISIMDGIEAVRSAFSRTYIDQFKCKDLIKALENYHQEYDPKKGIYYGPPVHDWSSHYSDAMRYLAVALPQLQEGMTAEDLERKYQEARYGNQAELPRFFRNDY